MWFQNRRAKWRKSERLKEEQRKREGNGGGGSSSGNGGNMESSTMTAPTSSSAGPSPTVNDPEGTTSSSAADTEDAVPEGAGGSRSPSTTSASVSPRPQPSQPSLSGVSTPPPTTIRAPPPPPSTVGGLGPPAERWALSFVCIYVFRKYLSAPSWEFFSFPRLYNAHPYKLPNGFQRAGAKRRWTCQPDARYAPLNHSSWRHYPPPDAHWLSHSTSPSGLSSSSLQVIVIIATRIIVIIVNLYQRWESKNWLKINSFLWNFIPRNRMLFKTNPEICVLMWNIKTKWW